MSPEKIIIKYSLEAIEDEMTAKLADKRYSEYLDDPETYSHDEIMKKYLGESWEQDID